MICGSCGNDEVDGDECIEDLLNDLYEPLKKDDVEAIKQVLAQYMWHYLGKIV